MDKSKLLKQYPFLDDGIDRENLENLVCHPERYQVPSHIANLNDLVYYMYIGYELFVGKSTFLRHVIYPKKRPVIYVDEMLGRDIVNLHLAQETESVSKYPRIVFSVKKERNVDGWCVYRLVVVEKVGRDV